LPRGDNLDEFDRQKSDFSTECIAKKEDKADRYVDVVQLPSPWSLALAIILMRGSETATLQR
jgi:hypothetical protein